MDWFPLCNLTHYSLQKGFSKPKQLAKKCRENSYPACGIADYKSISGAVAFYNACISNDIKPIIGCSFDGFSLFAKNHEGWLDLIKIVSSIDAEGNFSTSLVVNICEKGNLISVSNDESVSPIRGEDHYTKTESFMDTYYVDRSEADLHRILLCSKMKTTIPKINKALNSGDQIENHEFFPRSTSNL